MLSEKDKKLLRELIKNGRMSFSDLGRSCHMSRQSVFSKIKTLKRKGIIKNFTVNLNEKKLGLNLRAYILVETEPLRLHGEKALNMLRALSQVSQVHHLFGRYSFLIEVVVKDVNELSEIVKKVHGLEVVRRTETMIVFRTEKYRPQHPIEGILSE
jgi:Lrp/AsnC family transcriptional regulator for asnA, asnC and gidA